MNYYKIFSSILLSFIFVFFLPNNSKGQTSVTLAGDFQSELGCQSDWMPDCGTTHLTFNLTTGNWHGTFTIPAGSWEYKIAIDDSWTENYGLDGVFGGANISLSLPQDPQLIEFIFDPITHIVSTVYVGHVALTSQAEVDAFGVNNFTGIEYGLSIYGDDITDLTPLTSITSIGGLLAVFSNPSLINIDGLNNILSVGSGITFSINASLTNLDGLSNIKSVAGDLIISTNASLTNLIGLSNITNVNGNLNISYNALLTDLEGLNNIESVAGYLTIRNNPLLENLYGLIKISSLGGYLTVRNNSVLTNVAGLINITYVNGNLSIIENPLIINLNGLRNITSVNGDIFVQNNIHLEDFCGLYNIFNGELLGEYTISGNAINPDSSQIVGEGFCYTFIGSQILTTQAEVTAFGGMNFKVITGDLDLAGVNIADLTPLSTITTVGGNLYIRIIAGLTTLDGLSGISSVGGGLYVAANSVLTNLDGLSGITSVGGDIYVAYNSVLTNLDGLSGITSSVDGYLWVQSNALLTNLDGLSGIISTSSILEVDGNSALTNLDGLSNITSVGGYLRVSNNAALTNLDGLSGITSVGGDLWVRSNTALSSFCGLYSLLSVGNLEDGYSVYGNLENPTKEQIVLAGACQIEINIKVYLEGPYSNANNNMETSLGANIPLSSPYSQDAVTVSSIPPFVVDWVLVELRDKTDNTIIKDSRSAFVLNTGDVVDTDGTSPVAFNLPADDYYITVKHRNHLGIISNSFVPVN